MLFIYFIIIYLCYYLYIFNKINDKNNIFYGIGSIRFLGPRSNSSEVMFAPATQLTFLTES
jgi:hypothetical protein